MNQHQSTDQLRCANCKYYVVHPIPNHGVQYTRGQCHCHPETTYVQPDYWCGEFSSGAYELLLTALVEREINSQKRPIHAWISRWFK